MKKIINKIMCLGVISGLLLETFPVWALTKDESIYAKLNNSGEVNKVIISEHLEKTEEGKTIDRTKLINIENINGDEKFTRENGKLVWESNGKDIYYQGQTDEKLPISLEISYYLDGKESTVNEMLGKKGKVKIVLKYTNNDKHTVNVNGKNTTLYTPFVIAASTIIPNTTNKNIKVTNGKVITNGTNSVIAAISTPGLYESLGIDKLKGMDTIEITYETESFELNSIYSVATPKLGETNDFDMLNNIDKIYDSINTLSSSSNKLKNGSGQLLEGANKLKDGVNKLVSGINQAYNGSKQITDTVEYKLNELEKDTSEAIDQNTLNYIKNNAINSSKETAVNTAKDLTEAKFTNEYKKEIGNQAVESIRQSDTYKQLKANIAQLEQAGIPSLVQLCSQDVIPEEYLETCATNATYIGQYTTLSQMITIMEETAKQTAITTAEQTAISTAEQVSSTVSEIVAGKVSESVAIQVATKAKETAKEETLNSLTPLLQGLKQLTNGLNEINSNMSILDNGTKELTDGISLLDSGISQFNSQGINKITNLVNGDIKTLEGKIKALGKLSEEYKTFDDLENGTKGETKIIMVVDQVKANSTKTVVKTDKFFEKEESLWDKIKGLFK